MPVSIVSNGTLGDIVPSNDLEAPTKANSLALSFYGLAWDPIPPGGSGRVVVAGSVNMINWEPILGPGNLTLEAGKQYYLWTDGKLTSNSAQASAYIRRVGVASTTTEMKIEPLHPIRR